MVGLGGEGILRTYGQEKGAQAVIEEAIAQGITYFDSGRVYAERGITPEKLIRYALSQHITVAIVGCSTPAHVRMLEKMGRNFEPMSLEEQDSLVRWFQPYASKLAYYRGVF